MALTPRDELLRLVPEDVGFCVVIQDLRGHGTALTESPFLKQFRSSSFGAKILKAEETEKLTEVDKFLQENLGVNSVQLRDEILGDALVLAYRPGPPGRPEEEQGLVLVRARDEKLLARLLERVTELQKSSGDVTSVEPLERGGRKYYRRTEKKGVSYYYLHGPVLALGTKETILQQLIDLDAQAPSEGVPPLARQFRLLGVDKPLAALLVNPRSFEPALRQKAVAARGAQAVALKRLLDYWKALDGIAISVGLEEHLELALAVRIKPEGLPAAARRFFSTAAKPSELWSAFPGNAMVAVAGRVDLSALLDLLSEFLSDEARKAFRAGVEGTAGAVLGKDIFGELVPQLGPDWGFCVAAPSATDKRWFPEIVAALRIKPGQGDNPTDLALWNGLNSLATLAVLQANATHPGKMSLRTSLQDKVEVRYLVNPEGFPPGLEPAFALKSGFLVLASSPEVIRRFRGKNGDRTPKTPQRVLSPFFPAPADGDVPLLRVSLRELHDYLQKRREPIVSYVAKKNDISASTAGRQLDGLISVLQFLDRIELSQSNTGERAVFTLRVRTTRPLK